MTRVSHHDKMIAYRILRLTKLHNYPQTCSFGIAVAKMIRRGTLTMMSPATRQQLTNTLGWVDYTSDRPRYI